MYVLGAIAVTLITAYACYYITFKRRHEGPADPYSGLDHPDY